MSAREAAVAGVVADLARAVVTGLDVVDFLHHLVDRSLGLLEVDAAGIMLTDSAGRLRMWASSSHTTELWELFELQVDSGPCLTAFRSGEPVNPPSSEAARSWWPEFSRRAEAVGFGAVHAVPLRAAPQTLGALNLFTIDDRALTGDQVGLAQTLTDIATIALTSTQPAAPREVMAHHLHRGVAGRVVLEQAKGMLAHRDGLSIDAAYARIRDIARHRGQTLSTVAAQVVSHRGVIPARHDRHISHEVGAPSVSR